MTPFIEMKPPFDPAVFQPREDETIFEYWTSLSPLAPFFGVEWRMTRAFFGAKPAAPGRTARKQAAKPAAAKPPVPAKAAKPEPVEEAEILAQTPAQEKPAPAAAAPKAEAKPEPKPEPKPAPKAMTIADILMDAAPDAGSDLTRLKGIGEKLQTELNGMGLFTVEQIALLAEKDLDWIDERLTAFRGRSRRDDWIGQAKALVG